MAARSAGTDRQRRLRAACFPELTGQLPPSLPGGVAPGELPRWERGWAARNERTAFRHAVGLTGTGMGGRDGAYNGSQRTCLRLDPCHWARCGEWNRVQLSAD